MRIKYELISSVSCLVFLISLIFLIQVRHLLNRTKLDFLEWHIATVTAAAYTVVMPIEE